MYDEAWQDLSTLGHDEFIPLHRLIPRHGKVGQEAVDVFEIEGRRAHGLGALFQVHEGKVRMAFFDWASYLYLHIRIK
jgi:hypothetical protein